MVDNYRKVICMFCSKPGFHFCDTWICGECSTRIGKEGPKPEHYTDWNQYFMDKMFWDTHIHPNQTHLPLISVTPTKEPEYSWF